MRIAETKDKRVSPIGQMCEPFRARDHTIKLIAMDHKEMLAISSLMNSLSCDLYASQRAAAEIAEGFVVISRHVDNAGSAVDLAQDLMQHGCMGFGPIPSARQPPAIDDIAHKEELVAWGAGQKRRQGIGLAAPGAQMHV